MKFQTITHSVKRGKWRDKAGVEPDDADLEFAKVRVKVLLRDRNTCQSCGTHMPKGAEVHHVDDCHANNKDTNLITLCSLCHAWHHIGFLGKNGALFLANNELENPITAAEINTLMLACAVVMNTEKDADGFEDLKKVVDVIMNGIKASSRDVFNAWGSHDLKEFASALMRSSDEVYASREAPFVGLGVAVLPSALFGEAKSALSKDGEYGGFGHYANWESLYTQAIKSKEDGINGTVIPDEVIESEKTGA